MKCRHCQQTRYIRVSRSRDRWYFRFFLAQYLRCHYCNFGFLAPSWKHVPVAKRRSITEDQQAGAAA